MSEFKIKAQLLLQSSNRRLVRAARNEEQGGDLIVELRERDALGGDRWTEVERVSEGNHLWMVLLDGLPPRG